MGALVGVSQDLSNPQMVHWALAAYLGKVPLLPHGIVVLFRHRGPQDAPFDEQPPSPLVHVPLRWAERRT